MEELVTEPLFIEVLLAALGIAVNPPAVIAAILLVASSGRKALAFAGGWAFGLFIVGSIVMVAGDAFGQSGGSSVPMLVLKVAVGITLLGLAGMKWRSHRTSGDKELPGWMSRLYNISASRAFLAAALFAALNPKTIAFNAAGVLAIIGASLTVETEWAALVAFVLLASLSVTAPVAFSVFAPRRSEEVLALAERWLGDNSALVAAAVLLVLGLVVLCSGAYGLAQIYRPA
jgi:threonine/homoserine/homoserine lactone efflux protein